MMALYVVSLMFSWHIWRFLLHKFNRLADFFLAISSVCLLNESLLSRTKISAAALCISVGTVMVE